MTVGENSSRYINMRNVNEAFLRINC